MTALRARIHERAGLSEAPPSPQLKSGPTGPTAPHGKATSSGNSLKHGLASGRIIIPGEDPAAIEALLSDLIKEHAPVNETESLLVQQMAQSCWLMQHALRIQNQAFTETRVDTHKLALFLPDHARARLLLSSEHALSTEPASDSERKPPLPAANPISSSFRRHQPTHRPRVWKISSGTGVFAQCR